MIILIDPWMVVASKNYYGTKKLGERVRGEDEAIKN